MLLKQNQGIHLKTYSNSQELTQITVRMDKMDTSFFYFTLEANENICFYSTLDFEKGQKHRDIVVYITPELLQDFKNILNHLQKFRSIQVLSESIYFE